MNFVIYFFDRSTHLLTCYMLVILAVARMLALPSAA